MNETNHLKINGIERFQIKPQTIIDNLDGGLTITEKICAKIVDAHENAIIEAIFEAAKRDGITELFLIDRQFLLDAIKNEFERRKQIIIQSRIKRNDER